LRPNRPGGAQEGDNTDNDNNNKEATATTVSCTLPSTGEIIGIPLEVVRATWDQVMDASSDDEPSISTMVLACLKACPMDLKRPASHRIVMVGGVVQMLAQNPNPSLLSKRLQAECLHASQTNARYRMLQPCCKEMQFPNLLFAPDVMGWMGGSIMGTMALSEEPSWIFRQAWMERLEREKERQVCVVEQFDDFGLSSASPGKDKRKIHPSTVLLPDWQSIGRR
jgi:hypothetical protein